MAALLKTIRGSLFEVNLGLKGDLTMSENMERIVKALATDTVPTNWAQIAYPSLRTLSNWLPDLGRRASQLSEWVSSFTLPNSVWISGGPSLHLCIAIHSAFAQMVFWGVLHTLNPRFIGRATIPLYALFSYITKVDKLQTSFRALARDGHFIIR